MYFCIGGFDFTYNIPSDTINFTDKVNDPQGGMQFDIMDSSSVPISTQGPLVTIQQVPRIFGGVIPYQAGGQSIQTLVPLPTTPTISSEVIIFDETMAVPASTFLGGKNQFTDTTFWILSGTISSTITRGVPQYYNITQTFANNAVGTGFITQTTQAGYIQPGQSYMFSVYVQVTSALTNASGIFKMDFLDQNNNVLATQSNTFTTATGTQRMNVQGVAPANTASIKVSIGGQTTSSTNSGTIVYGTAQLEPMWFTAEGVSYPTSDCTFEQANCFRMPDDTVSRARIFAGYIEDVQISYEGKTRTYHVTVAPAERVLDNTNLITKNYNAQTDAFIINDVVQSFYFNVLTANSQFPNIFGPASIQTGITVDAISYIDLSFREILNSLVDQSGFSYYVSPYYQVFYNPLFYNICPFSFSDTPDNITSFGYYDYLLEYDGTQIKQRVKVIGANPTGPQITDSFGGGGTQVVLSQIPNAIPKVTTANGANTLTVGILGINTYSQGYGALVDPPNREVNFPSATPAGTVACTYTYQTPVVNQVNKLDGISATVNAPAYVKPAFDAKINDGNLASLTAGNIRGLSEIARWGLPVTIITLKSPKYIQPGFAVYFTSSLDNIINRPFVVMEIKAGKVLGNGINEYYYTLGTYVPNLIDHVRNHHKATNRTVSVGAVTTAQQTDVAATEQIFYSERFTHTP